MEERPSSFEHQQRRLISKLYLKRICFSILSFIILSFIIFGSYIIQYQSASFINLSISQKYFNPTELKPILLEQNLSPKLDPIRCVVYVKGRDGRLGNRIFIVASAYGLARLHSCHLYFTPQILSDIKNIFTANFSSLLISTTTFDLFVNQTNSKLKIHKYVQCEFIRELTRPNAISKGQLFELIGYWQSYLHFINYANELRYNIFTGIPSVLEKVSHFFVDIYQQKFHITPTFDFQHHNIFKQQLIDLHKIVWIAIHIRRTDFIGLRFSSSDEYILNAIKYFTEKYSNAHFIVASDDRQYCRNLFQNRSNIFITPNSFSVGDDLITLSLCQHSIVTGGTFSWWIAFLSNGEVVHDKMYASGCEKREHYYPPWFLIDGYVRAHQDGNFTLK